MLKNALCCLLFLAAACAHERQKNAASVSGGKNNPVLIPATQVNNAFSSIDFSYSNNWTGGYSLKVDSAGRVFLALRNRDDETLAYYRIAATKKEIAQVKELEQRLARALLTDEYESGVSDAEKYRLIIDRPSGKRTYWVHSPTPPAPLNAIKRAICRLALGARRVKIDSAVAFESRARMF